MFVLAHARLLVLHTPCSGNVKLEGGVDFSCEQSVPTYISSQLHTPLKRKLHVMFISFYDD